MNNTVFIAGAVERIMQLNGTGRDVLSMTIRTEYEADGRTVGAYIPVQVTIPGMVEKYKDIAVGTMVSVEGRFESYKGKDGQTKYNVTQLTAFQPIDEGYLNHAVVWGRLSSDIRVNMTQGGHKVASFNIANSRLYRKDGEWIEVTSFLPVTAWDSSADMAEKYLKGDAVWITGHLASHSYESKDGNRVYVTEINADAITRGGTGRRNVICGDGSQNSSDDIDWSRVPQSSWEYERMEALKQKHEESSRRQDNKGNEDRQRKPQESCADDVQQYDSGSAQSDGHGQPKGNAGLPQFPCSKPAQNSGKDIVNQNANLPSFPDGNSQHADGDGHAGNGSRKNGYEERESKYEDETIDKGMNESNNNSGGNSMAQDAGGQQDTDYQDLPWNFDGTEANNGKQMQTSYPMNGMPYSLPEFSDDEELPFQ